MPHLSLRPGFPLDAVAEERVAQPPVIYRFATDLRKSFGSDAILWRVLPQTLLTLRMISTFPCLQNF